MDLETSVSPVPAIWLMAALVFAASVAVAQTADTAKLQGERVVWHAHSQPGVRKSGDPSVLKNLPSFFAWVQATHKAPYPQSIAALQRRKVMEAIARQKTDPQAMSARRSTERLPEQFGNIRVNQDRDPYPKSVVGVAVDPGDGLNLAVAGGGPFYVTKTAGRTWTEDHYPFLPVVEETDDVGYIAPAAYEDPVGIAFDRSGHTYTALSVANFSSQAMETDVAVAVGQNKGLSVDNKPLLQQSVVCQLPLIRCDASVGTIGIVTDTTGTATDGNTYVIYGYYCNQPETCPDTLEVGQSAVVVQEVTGTPTYGYGGDPSLDVGYASLVIDGSGQPHLIQISYSDKPTLGVYLDDSYTPLTTFVNSPSTTDYGYFSPIQCTAHHQKAYCVFQATKVGNGPSQGSPDIYLATIELASGSATISRINNDAPAAGKNHFDASIAIKPSGEIYVGWFDDRLDPTGVKLNYFVAKSTDDGKSFPTQKPVNDAAFDPSAVSFPGVPTGSVAAGPDGAVHAVWTDTRDGTGLQIWTQTLRF